MLVIKRDKQAGFLYPHVIHLILWLESQCFIVFQRDMPNIYTPRILSGAPLQFLSAQRSKTRSGRCVQRISGKQLGSSKV